METRSLLLASILLLGLNTPARAIVSAPEFLRGQRVELLNTLAQGQQTQTDPRLQETDRLEQTILVAGVRLMPTDPRLTEADRIEQQIEDLYQQGKYAEASRIAEQVLAIREAILGDHPDTATALITLGFIYDTMGQYADAKPLYERALTIRERQLGANHLDTATSLNRLAFLFYEMGRYEEAEPLYHRALAIHEAQLGSEHLVTAISFNFLALLYEVTNRYEEAERLYQRTLDIREKQLGSSHPDIALSLDNLAVLYQKTGRYEEAESLHQRALAVREEQEEDPNTALSLTLLADLYQVMGRYTEADPLYKRALTINEQQLGFNHPNTAQSLNNLATLYWSEEHFDQSLDFLRRGLDVEEINILQNVATLTEREQKAYLSTITWSSDAIVSLHLQHLPTNPQANRVALTTILRRKGRILDTLSNRLQRLRADASPADRGTLEQLSQLYTQLTNLYNKGLGNLTPEAYRQQVQTLESQIEQLQKQLAQDLPELSPQPVTLEAIQTLIPQDAVLIEFFRYQPFNPKAKSSERYGESRYAAYVLRPGNGDPVGIDLGEAAAIDQRLGFFRQNLTDPTSTNQLSQSSKIVYQAVFQPLTPYLGNGTHLLISPDSNLNLIPFAALQNPQGQYLLEGYEITALSSGRDLVRYQTHYAAQEPPVIIAHPNYNGSSDPQAAQLIAQANRGIIQVSAITNSTPAALPSSSVEQIRSVGVPFPWSDLPGTEREVSLIAPKLASAVVLKGNQATEGAIKVLRSPAVLHLATHGFFLPSGGKDENPLVRSGLILTGANLQDSRQNNGEDGVLTALEVSGLDLRGTSLVVMSACDTGKGDVADGEGIYGLRRAFTLAGAESQLFSLWEVNDWATQALLTRYYDYILAGRGRSDAWRQTQLDMLQGRLDSTIDPQGLQSITDTAHPNYWAAFVPSGNWEPMTLK